MASDMVGGCNVPSDRADRMVGQVLGAVGHLPSILTELEVSYYLLR